MATYQALAQSIIEFHEKLNYAENESIRGRVLKAINKAINHIWSKADWTFKVQFVNSFTYFRNSINNTLPENFLSFQHVGHVIHMNEDEVTAKSELGYMPLNEMMQLLHGESTERGDPERYSIGGPISGDGNQRAIFLYPIPNDDIYLKLIYQARAPKATLDNWEDEILGIPQNWHESVIEEVAILFRLMDKSADTSGQAAIVATALAAMMRDEPHGREDAVKMTAAYAWRMNLR